MSLKPYSPSPGLWPPQQRGVETTIKHLAAGRSVCLHAPTGGGKTQCAIEILKWADANNMRTAFYLNRRLLIGQTRDRYESNGLTAGVRAADWDDHFDISAPHQICSADTERSRVLDKGMWPLHDAGVVFVDEAHLMKTGTMDELLSRYEATGAKVVHMTATPIAMSDRADELVISGKMAEYRQCGALVPARVHSLKTPDLHKVKRSKTGEFVMDGKKKAIFTQSIVGDVLGAWEQHNPEQRPTMLYAPGKPESVWLTEKFMERGVSWCHIDATDAVVDGVRHSLTRKLWDEIIARYQANDIKGLSCRFKLREGIDCPQTYHCILATPIGSLASYIQTVGRAMRGAPGKTGCVITDHGGCYLRHGSPNADRPWDVIWALPEHAAASWNIDQIRDGKQPEAIRCPGCGGERIGGASCPHCGFKHPKSSRQVVMEDGKLKQVDGNMIRKPKVEVRPDTEQAWTRMYFGFKNKKVNQTFNQMRAYFQQEYGYVPPKKMPYMPVSELDWYRKVYNVPHDALIKRDGAGA